jgi:hypothetical protein
MACNNTKECVGHIINSECIGGQCQCLTDYQPDASLLQCLATVCRRGAACHTTSCCQLADVNSICDMTSSTDVLGSCACVTGYVPSVGGGPCAKKYVIGDDCTSSTQCSTVMADSTCSRSTAQCACSVGYQALADLSGCARLPLSQVSTCACVHVIDECDRLRFNVRRS